MEDAALAWRVLSRGAASAPPFSKKESVEPCVQDDPIDAFAATEFGLDRSDRAGEIFELGRGGVYVRAAIIEALMLRDGMDEEGAIEFFEYNIEGAKFSHRSPVFLRAC